MAKGTLSPQTSLLLAYGLYLAHGGTPEDFDRFSQEDADIMLAAYTAYRTFERVELIKGFAQVIAKMFGAEKR